VTFYRKTIIFLAGSIMNEELTILFQLSREVVLLGHRTTFVARVVFRRGHLIYLRVQHVAFGGSGENHLIGRVKVGDRVQPIWM